MAKKEVKQSKKEIIDKIIEVLNLWCVPISATIAIIWQFDAAVYVAAIIAALTNVLECVKIFIKE